MQKFGGMNLSFVNSITTLLFFMCMCNMCCSVTMSNAVVKLPPNVSIPALIAFGDSIVDQGINNNLKTLIKSNFPPYGKDFIDGLPTGRFSNGKTPADILAAELGITCLVPSYLDPSLQNQDLLTGVSFASGGTGYDPETPKIVSALSLTDQIEMFREYIGKLKEFVGEERTSYILANSLYILVAGSDDLANTYYILGIRKLEYDVPSYADLMVASASKFIQTIYEFGARRIAVFGVPPIGCLPSQRTLAGGVLRVCAEDHNQAAQIYNTKLSSMLHSLSRTLPQSKLICVDIYNPVMDIIINPYYYGFEIVDKGCCGSGSIEVVVLCNKLSKTCADSSKFVFWDSYHPTQKVYAIVVDLFITKYLALLF